MVLASADENNMNDHLETKVVDESKSVPLKIDEQKGMKIVDDTAVMLMVGSRTVDKDGFLSKSPSAVSPSSNVNESINDTSLSNLSTSDFQCIDTSSDGIKEEDHIILDIENAPFDEVLNNGGSDTAKSHTAVDTAPVDAVVVAVESEIKEIVEEYPATIDSASATTASEDIANKPTEEEQVIDTPIGKMMSVGGHKRANRLVEEDKLDHLESTPKKHSPDKDDTALHSNQESTSS